jgi:hypothetical protein
MSNFVVLLAISALARTPGGGEVVAQKTPWAEVKTTVFSEAWILPADLWRAPSGSLDERLLPTRMKRLVQRDFDRDVPEGEHPLAWCKTFGDFVAEWRRHGEDRKALDTLLTELRDARPKLHAEYGRLFFQLLQADALKSGKWDAGDDRDDDGMFVGPPIERRATELDPWKKHDGTLKFQQAAALIAADLDAIEEAENDFVEVAKQKCARYDSIGPVRDSYRTGDDGPGGPFAALRVKFRGDLPFPFTHFDADLAVLNTLDADRNLVTYTYSASDDFLWLAGEDFFYPVVTSSGEWCGTLMVRMDGFDLRGVPDGDDDRAASLRCGMGHLKRSAEERFRANGGKPRTISGAIPPFRVLGPVQK